MHCWQPTTSNDTEGGEKRGSRRCEYGESLEVGRTCPHYGLLSDSLTPLNRELRPKEKMDFIYLYSVAESHLRCFLFSEIVLVLTIQFVLFTHLV